MKTAAALFAAAVLLAGCSGSSDDEPAPEKTTASPEASRKFDGGALEKQAEDQAAQRDAALKELEKSVDRQARGTVVIRIKDGKVTPQGKRVEVKVGQTIALDVTSDVDEELHVHSDPEHTFAVKPGKDQTFTFTVDTPGQVAVEAHHADVTLVQLVVRP